MNNKYEAVIGLEIHAELNTKTKMFCRCKSDPFHSEPNSNICPVCLGLPGALPVANKAAVESTIMVGLALGCEIASKSKWDRKHYFYPDLPKGYQISQYDLPLCKAGYLNTNNTKIDITRIHLEEDTGTLQHPTGANYSLVNYNRSGVPLLELVTEPDIRTGKTARLFAQEYQRILRALGVAEADMEKGGMRVEANISIRTKEQTEQGEFGTKVEVKNLNSFRSAEKAIDFEIKRQAEVLEKGEKVVQETRGWHDTKQITFSQRVKEGAADYRYFPEPDLPPLELSDEFIEEVKAKMPALPQQHRAKYIELGLTTEQASILADDQKLAEYYRNVTESGITPKTAANWIINSVRSHDIPIDELVALLKKVEEGLPSNIAKDKLKEYRETGESLKVLTEETIQVTDEAEVEKVIDELIASHPEQVAQYKSGKQQLLAFFVGQVMSQTKGQANPQLVNELLRKKLKTW